MYKYVKYVDISSNSLSDISLLKDFKDLTTLNASKNQIASLEVFKDQNSFKKLQILNLSVNKIKSLEDISVPQLVRLNLAEN